MNSAKETKARIARRVAGPQLSARRQAQLARLRAEPPALTTKPAMTALGPAKSRHLRLYR
jgi:hypothetical protein